MYSLYCILYHICYNIHCIAYVLYMYAYVFIVLHIISYVLYIKSLSPLIHDQYEQKLRSLFLEVTKL